VKIQEKYIARWASTLELLTGSKVKDFSPYILTVSSSEFLTKKLNLYLQKRAKTLTLQSYS
jgi:hypothetical protein